MTLAEPTAPPSSRPGSPPRHSLDGVYSVEAMRQAAKRALSRAIFDSVDGGAAGELTVRQNQAAFDRVWLRPRAVTDGRP